MYLRRGSLCGAWLESVKQRTHRIVYLLNGLTLTPLAEAARRWGGVAGIVDGAKVHMTRQFSPRQAPRKGI